MIQSSLNILDLVGVAFIGVLGALAVRGIQSQSSGGKVESILQMLRLSHLTFQTQIAVLGALSAAVLITRTLLSVYFSRRILFFLSKRAAVVSANLIRKLLRRELNFIQRFSSQETLYSVTSGVGAITVGIIGTAVALLSDTTLLIFIVVGLIAVDPILALLTLFIFGAIGLVLFQLLHKKARTLGQKNAELSIASNQMILEVLQTYREAVVRDRRGYYANQIERQRVSLSNVLAELSFIPNISKYVLEVSVVLGAILISAIQFMLQDASHAVSTLAVFLAAGTRVAPAILRAQQGAIQIKSSIGVAEPTLNLITELEMYPQDSSESQDLQLDHGNFVPKVRIMDLTFTYDGASVSAISNANLTINHGEVVAFVGNSGAGKTTLADLILGVLSPDSGKVEISGLEPLSAITKWPGSIGYVPQEVVIADSSVRENISLGFPAGLVDENHYWNCLRTACLEDFVNQDDMKLELQVGELGSKLSGGQRQRLGIARAMFTNPRLLVLDEATSALDGQTELDISDSLSKMRGTVSIIVIAHRLSTIRNADKVAYFDKGKITFVGTFEEVRNHVPDFDAQAKLMGL
jgi:ABC-type bacteriocin/lantibiotic exporter with double-glycine peptidase domain